MCCPCQHQLVPITEENHAQKPVGYSVESLQSILSQLTSCSPDLLRVDLDVAVDQGALRIPVHPVITLGRHDKLVPGNTKKIGKHDYSVVSS